VPPSTDLDLPTKVDNLIDQGDHLEVASSSRWESLDEVIDDRTKLPLEVLREVAKYQRYLAAIERRTVQAARSEGRTWDEIGAAIGVSRQASWKRWGRSLVHLEPLDPATSPGPGRADSTAAVPARRWVVPIRTFADVEDVVAPYRTGEAVEIVLTVDDESLRREVTAFVSGLAYGSGGRVEALDDQRLHLVPSQTFKGRGVD